jgi:hypothetical protein
VKTIVGLCNLIRENNLEDTLTEVTKLVEIVLTTPVSTAKSERCFSTLKRVKTYLPKFTVPGTIECIHKGVIAEIPQFNKRVIDLFATQKDRREFLYK